MILEKTVFILGAGASAPYGFPTGKKLRNNICQDFYRKIKNLINKQTRELGRIEQQEMRIEEVAKDFVRAFEKSGNESIDLWLNRNKKYAEIGKMAIALNILEAEHGSSYYESVSDGEDWCLYLYKRMTETLLDEDSYKLFKDNQVSFITFNYDRSFEFYLYECLTHSFTALRKSIPPTDQLFPFLPLHVFGKIADLPWEGRLGLLLNAEYRCEVKYHIIDRMKKNIRTIFEDAHGEYTKEIKAEIQRARRVFFLGFGYHPENLEVLGIPEVISGNQEIYGTALGFTEKEIEQIKLTLSANFNLEERMLYPNNPRIEPWNCYKLLREHL